jgi:hypothetical protein
MSTPLEQGKSDKWPWIIIWLSLAVMAVSAALVG